MTTDLTYIFDAIRRTRKRWFGVAMCLSAFAAPMIVGPHFAAESPGLQWTASAIGLLTLACAVGIFHLAWQMRDPQQAPLSLLLLKHPRDVSWVYLEQVHAQAGGITLNKAQSIKVCTVARKTLTLQVSGRCVNAVMSALSARLPHATFGYDKEIHKRYKADPSSLVSATI